MRNSTEELFQPNENIENNSIIIEFNRQMTLLTAIHDQEQWHVSKNLMPYNEQQIRYQIQAEALGREVQLITRYIKKAEESNLNEIDVDALKKDYVQMSELLFNDLIENHKVLFKSRGK
jgi:flagellar biosynthesis/type III secretory pathway ATPase